MDAIDKRIPVEIDKWARAIKGANLIKGASREFVKFD